MASPQTQPEDTSSLARMNLIIESDGESVETRDGSEAQSTPFDMAAARRLTEDYAETIQYCQHRRWRIERGSQHDLHELSKRLFSEVLRGETSTVVHEMLKKQQKTRAPLRIVVQGEAALLNLPWELLSFDHRWVARDSMLELIRGAPVPPRNNFPARMQGPLRVLFAHVERPSDEPVLGAVQQSMLNEKLWPWIQLGTVELKTLSLDRKSGTLAALRTEVENHPFDIVYLLAHGRADPPGIGFLDLDGNPQWTDVETFVNALGNHRLPEVLILGCCHLSTEPKSDVVDVPFGGLAREAVAAGIPNVIAMQSAITVRRAHQFAAEVIDALARGKSLPEAIASNRDKDSSKDDVKDDAEWSLPVHWADPDGSACRFDLPFKTEEELKAVTQTIKNIADPMDGDLNRGLAAIAYGERLGIDHGAGNYGEFWSKKLAARFRQDVKLRLDGEDFGAAARLLRKLKVRCKQHRSPDDEENEATLIALASQFVNKARSARSQGKWESAEEHYRLAIEKCREVLEQPELYRLLQPIHDDALQESLWCSGKMGIEAANTHIRQGDSPAATRGWREGIRYLRQRDRAADATLIQESRRALDTETTMQSIRRCARRGVWLAAEIALSQLQKAHAEAELPNVVDLIRAGTSFSQFRDGLLNLDDRDWAGKLKAIEQVESRELHRRILAGHQSTSHEVATDANRVKDDQGASPSLEETLYPQTDRGHLDHVDITETCDAVRRWWSDQLDSLRTFATELRAASAYDAAIDRCLLHQRSQFDPALGSPPIDDEVWEAARNEIRPAAIDELRTSLRGKLGSGLVVLDVCAGRWTKARKLINQVELDEEDVSLAILHFASATLRELKSPVDLGADRAQHIEKWGRCLGAWCTLMKLREAGTQSHLDQETDGLAIRGALVECCRTSTPSECVANIRPLHNTPEDWKHAAMLCLELADSLLTKDDFAIDDVRAVWLAALRCADSAQIIPTVAARLNFHLSQQTVDVYSGDPARVDLSQVERNAKLATTAMAALSGSGEEDQITWMAVDAYFRRAFSYLKHGFEVHHFRLAAGDLEKIYSISPTALNASALIVGMSSAAVRRPDLKREFLDRAEAVLEEAGTRFGTTSTLETARIVFQSANGQTTPNVEKFLRDLDRIRRLGRAKGGDESQIAVEQDPLVRARAAFRNKDYADAVDFLIDGFHMNHVTENDQQLLHDAVMEMLREFLDSPKLALKEEAQEIRLRLKKLDSLGAVINGLDRPRAQLDKYC